MSNKWLSIDDIQPGMIVAKAVSDREGRVIIPEGGRLTPMAINRLPRWGIVGVDVFVEENVAAVGASNGESGGSRPLQVPTPEQDLEFAARITAAVDLRFSNLERTPLNDEYRQFAIKCLIEKGRGVVPGL